MCWTAAQRFEPDLRAPAAAREFCRRALSSVLSDTTGREQVVDAAQLVVSELVTNAVRAQAHMIRAVLAVHREVARISVIDDAPGWPQSKPYSDDVGGRGLHIVSRTAMTWDAEPMIPGKVVWAEIPVPEDLTLDMPSCHHPTRITPNQDAVRPARRRRR